ncbi:MAG TPA: hypothetical protein VLJ57_08065, partial [Burkholderiaceae bacterium]|nr:hypothetical protein [Burkholderiaceae bacterium]
MILAQAVVNLRARPEIPCAECRKRRAFLFLYLHFVTYSRATIRRGGVVMDLQYQLKRGSYYLYDMADPPS